MKLELKHLAPYLPYGLLWVFEGGDVLYKVVGLDTTRLGVILYDESGDNGCCSLTNGKPILSPLSSMSLGELEELNSLIDNPVRVVVSSGNWMYVEGTNSDPWDGKPTLSLDNISKINEYLFSNHFDVFGLIDKDLAINKDKL